MKRARISLARLMAVVVVVAVNCAMIAPGYIDFVRTGRSSPILQVRVIPYGA